MAKLLKPDGSMVDVTPANPAGGFTLDELYQLIGDGCDYVQEVPLHGTARPYVSMILDEDAKHRRPPRPPMNERATRMLHRAGGMPLDFVIGTVLLVERGELK